MKLENKRKLIIITLFSLILVGVVLLGKRFGPTLANEFYPDHYDLVEINEPHLINDMATQTADQFETEPDGEKEIDDQEPTISTPTPDSSTLLQNMVQDYENNTFSQSGWLHFVYNQESEVSNGVPLPDNHLCDGWYLVNEQGYVTQHVVSYHDDVGNLNQREIYKNNTFTNLSTGDKMETEGPYRLKLDLGVSKYMLEMQMVGSILTHEVSTLDENPVEKYTVFGTYDKPTVFGNSSQPVESARMTLLFDQATGNISEMEYVYILADGTEELYYRVQITTLEWGELPQEFVQLLESKK